MLDPWRWIRAGSGLHGPIPGPFGNGRPGPAPEDDVPGCEPLPTPAPAVSVADPSPGTRCGRTRPAHGDRRGDLPASGDVIHITMQEFAALLDSATGELGVRPC